MLLQILFRPHENDYGDAEMDFAEWNANPDNANKFIKVILSVMSTTGQLKKLIVDMILIARL